MCRGLKRAVSARPAPPSGAAARSRRCAGLSPTSGVRGVTVETPQRSRARGELGASMEPSCPARVVIQTLEDIAEVLQPTAPRRRTRSFPGDHAEQWSANGFEKWRQRRFSALLAAAGLEDGRTYDLRHSFASLLLHEGRDVIYVARQLGHSAELTLRTSTDTRLRSSRTRRSCPLRRQSRGPAPRSGGPEGTHQGPTASSRSTVQCRKPLQTDHAPTRIRTWGLLLRRPGTRHERRERKGHPEHERPVTRLVRALCAAPRHPVPYSGVYPPRTSAAACLPRHSSGAARDG